MHPSIPGLYYIPNALKIDNIINTIDHDPITWTALSEAKNSRKVKHYGYLYNYKSTKVNEKTHLLPDYLQPYHDTLKKVHE